MVGAQGRRPLGDEIPKQMADTGQGAVAGACDAVVGEVSLGSPSATAHCCSSPRKGDVREQFREPGGERQRGRRRPRDQQIQDARGGDPREGGERGKEYRPDRQATVSMMGKTINLSLYPRLMSILTTTDDLHPHLRSFGWLVKRMDELYDARRRAEQAIFSAEEDYLNLDSGSRRHLSFPAFAYKHFKNRHGIKLMVRSVCLDLVCNVQFYRKKQPEVEVFARFMEEFYGQKELCFFLDLRAEAHRVTRVGARPVVVGTQAVWMTLPDCVRVAKGVFFDSTTLYFRDLVATVSDQMETGGPGGRISLSAFLYLAMVCFVSPKDPSDGSLQQHHQQKQRSPRQLHGLTSAAASDGRRLLVCRRGKEGAGISAVGCVGSGGGKNGCHTEDLDSAGVGSTRGRSLAAFSPSSTITPWDRRALGKAAASGGGRDRSGSFFGSNSAAVAGTRDDGLPSPSSVFSPTQVRATTTLDAGWDGLSQSPQLPSSAVPGFLSRSQLSPQSLLYRSDPPSPVQSPLTTVERQENVGGSENQRLGPPLGVGFERGDSPASTSPQTPPSMRQRPQQQQPRQQYQQHRLVEDHPGSMEENRGMVRPRPNGGGGDDRRSDIDSPDTSTILERGLHSLLSFVRGDEGGEGGQGGGVRPDRSSARDGSPLPSPASSSHARASDHARAQEASSLPPAQPTPPSSLSAPATATVPGDAEWRRRTADSNVESQSRAVNDNNNSSSGNRSSGGGGGGGGGVVPGPTRQATGGGRASSPVVAVEEPRTKQDRSTNFAPANESCNGGGYRSPVPGLVGGREEARPHDQLRLQLQLQHQRPSAAGRETTATPHLPFSPVTDSPRPPGGPLRALSPLALLERLERSNVHRSQSPTRKSQRKQDGHSTTSTAQKEQPAGETKQDHVTDAITGAQKSTGAPSLSSGRGYGGEGDRHSTTAVWEDKIPVAARNAGNDSNVKGDTSHEYPRPDGHSQDGVDFSHDVASVATDWLASFEQRFMPCLMAEVRTVVDVAGTEGARSATASGTLAGVVASSGRRADGLSSTNYGMLLPAPIARVLHEEVSRVLALNRRDLDIVARVSPELLQSAVVKSFWMFEV
ncbi:unnamed protein product [Ectocarpus sp. 12 AP-2014]